MGFFAIESSVKVPRGLELGIKGESVVFRDGYVVANENRPCVVSKQDDRKARGE
jgi:hypothetical protein